MEILRDDLPELAEVIRVRLVDVKLVSPSPVNFSVVDGLQLNTPPRIRSDKSEVLVVINENDEARGIIRLTHSAMLVREDVGTAVLQLRREGNWVLLKLIFFRNLIASSCSSNIRLGNVQSFILLGSFDQVK